VEEMVHPKVEQDYYELEQQDYCAFDSHDWDTSIMLTSNPPKFKCKNCESYIFVNAYNLLNLIGKI